ncbi:hypothetical protein CRUP_033118 [Coryphaenoides rupestris]|nr:hypothetical protein CRUP_033118 [Coryphaenoides rupestris]
MLEFGEKTHQVSMTALRLLQRMKRDWMHTGRRPSGLCGAALLVAARMHDFRRTVKEVIGVVKVCQATLRKRLTEFEDTPTSHLTIDEFMRKLTQDFLCQVMEQEGGEEPEPRPGPWPPGRSPPGGLPGCRPCSQPLSSILGLLPTAASLQVPPEDVEPESGELDLEGIDDQEIEKYILSECEVKTKTALWMKHNEDFLKEQKGEEASTAGEAIEKMLEQKRISTKINYEVLRDLNQGGSGPSSPLPPPSESSSTSGAAAGRPRPPRRKKPSRKSNSLAATASIMGKRLRPLVSSVPKKKRDTSQVAIPTAPRKPAPSTPSTPLPADTPQRPDTPPGQATPPQLATPPRAATPPDEAPPPGEALDEEEADACVSVLQLMARSEYGCDTEEEEEFF